MSHVRWLIFFSLLQAVLLLLNVLALLEHCLHHIGGLQDKDLTNKVGHLQSRIETTDDDFGIPFKEDLLVVLHGQSQLLYISGSICQSHDLVLPCLRVTLSPFPP